MCLDDVQAQTLKQSIAKYIVHEAQSFNFSPFHPTIKVKDNEATTPLSDVYIEHYFQEITSNQLESETTDSENFDPKWDENLLSVNEIINSVDFPNRGEKILLIGKRGCGISTCMLRTALDHAEFSTFDFVLFLTQNSFDYNEDQENFIISFGKQKLSLHEFCVLYGRYTIVFVDNTELLPIKAIQNLTSHENLKETTILFTFQTTFSDGVPQKTPYNLFSRFYLSYGFEMSADLSKLGRIMMGNYWSESAFCEVRKSLPHDNDLVSLSIITALMHRKYNFREKYNVNECSEKFLNFLIIDQLKNENVKRQAIQAEEILQAFVSLQQNVVESYIHKKLYSDKAVASKLSTSLKMFLIIEFLKSQTDCEKSSNDINDLRSHYPYLANEVSESLKPKTMLHESSRIIIESNTDLLKLLTADVNASPQFVSFFSLKLDEIVFSEPEISTWKRTGYCINKLVISVRYLSVNKLFTFLGLFQKIDEMHLTFKKSDPENFGLLILPQLTSSARRFASLKLFNVPLPFYFDSFSRLNVNSLAAFKALKLHKVSLELSSLSELMAMAEHVVEIGSNIESFEFEMSYCTINVTNVERNVALLFSCFLFFQNHSCDGIKWSEDLNISVNSEHQLDSVDRTCLKFDSGKIQKLDWKINIAGKSCAVFTDMFSRARFRKSENNDFGHVAVCCEECKGSKCSSLLLVLSVLNSKSASPESSNIEANVDFGDKNFANSNFELLAELLTNSETKFSGKLNVLTKKSEVLEYHKNALKTYNIEVSDSEVKSEAVDIDLTSEYSPSELSSPFSTSYDVIEVEVDNTGWGFSRFMLTPQPITVTFSNGVTIEWSENSTDEDRLVCVEVHSMPEKLIRQVCESKNEPICHLSPFLFIDQIEDKPFLKPVTVTMPYSVLGIENDETLRSDWTTKVFSYVDGDVRQWRAVRDQSKYELMSNVFKYTSTTFSPVGAVTNSEESSLNPTDFWEIYLPESVYLIVCPSQYDTKIIFDCRKFRNEEEHKKLKLTAGARFRKLNEMKNGDLIYGSIAGNLLIDENYGYSLRDDKKLVFYYPDPEHESNKQEYKMRIISKSRDPEGTITYYKEFIAVEEPKMQKLFHLKLELQVIPINADRPGYKRKSSFAECTSPKKHATSSSKTVAFDSQIVLTHEVLMHILKTCKLSWIQFLEKMKLDKGKISELEDQSLGEHFSILKEKFTIEQGKEFIRKLCQICEVSPSESDTKISNFYTKHSNDFKEAFWQCCLDWLQITPSHYRKLSTIMDGARKSGVENLAENCEVIPEGTCKRASRELSRVIDKRGNEQDVIKEVAAFLNSLGDNESRDLAFSLLMKL